MGICSICKRISATGADHLDCVQLRRVEAEDEGFREGLPERLNATEAGDLGVEIRAVLEHLARERAESEKP